VSKIDTLLTRYGYKQGEKEDFGVRYWLGVRYALPISVVNSIWEAAIDDKIQRGTGSKAGLRRLELAIQRSERK
jgi:hypothetical protein